jgi:hypothetical protein
MTRSPDRESLGCAGDLFSAARASMRKQYLHLSAYTCDVCSGPVIAGSLGVRENEISREIETSTVGAICISCGHRQDKATEPGRLRYFFPIEWESVNIKVVGHSGHSEPAYVEALNRAERH